ncbi:MAG: cardiolipin synthase B [Rhodospirillaceae bacterium]|nr:cardiolipin synthase B [Rhodospirillaceae bacterium]
MRGRPPGMPAAEPTDIRLAFQATLGAPFFEGNRIDVLRNGREIFPAMLDAIARAERSIRFLTFVYWKGDIAERFAEALAERARAGLAVQILLDAYGCAPMPKDLIARMRDAGAAVQWFRPLATWRVGSVDNRTHRKVLVIDAQVAFTGGVGIAEEWEGDARHPGEWRDTHFRIQGPAVHGLLSAFLGNWAESGRPIADGLAPLDPLPAVGSASILVVRSTASVCWADAATMLHTAPLLARRRLRIVTPYFTPGDRAAGLLADAAARGLAVEVLIPGPHIDKRVSELAASITIGRLIDAGVRFWRYQPTMIHAKVIIIDDQAACIGSINFNQRSMSKDDEIGLVVLDPDVVATLDRHFDEDLANSTPVDKGSWRRRGPLRRTLEMVARPLRPQV